MFLHPDFLGGSLGSFIRSQIKSLCIDDYFVEIAGETRIVLLSYLKKKRTEILESGPLIFEGEAALF